MPTSSSSSMALEPPPVGIHARFQHLLRPFRELADNWNVELADDLIEYVRQELEGLEEASAVNFAQAALLVQNSALVYSKKVESLYDLILKALERLSAAASVDKHGSKQQQKAENEENNDEVVDDDVSNFDEDDDDLDDFRVLPEAAPEETTRRYLMKESTLSGGEIVGLAPAPPADLSVSIGSNPTVAKGALVLNMCKSTLVDPFTGALLMDRNIFEPIDRKERSSIAVQTGHETNAIGATEGQTPEAPSAASEGQGDVNGGEVANDYSFDDAGGGGDDGGYDIGEGQGFEERRDASLTRRRESRKTKQSLSWGDLLDPNVPSAKRKDKPFKKGRCYSNPADEKLSLESTDALAKDNAQLLLEPLNIPLLALIIDSRRPDQVRTAKDAGLEGLAFPEFESAVKARRKQLRKLQGKPSSEESAIGYADGEGERGEEYDYEDAGVGDWGGGDESFHQAPQGEDAMMLGGIENGGDGDCTNATSMPESYAEVVRNHVARFLENARNWASESRLTMRVRGWHDHLEPILKEQEARPGFDLREYESILVNEFNNLNESRSFESLVEKAEELKVMITDTTNNNTSAFSDISSSEDQENQPSFVSSRSKQHLPSSVGVAKVMTRWQVCRLFLTTLELANQGAVQIEDRFSSGCDTEFEFDSRSTEGLNLTFVNPPKHTMVKSKKKQMRMMSMGDRFANTSSSPLRGVLSPANRVMNAV